MMQQTSAAGSRAISSSFGAARPSQTLRHPARRTLTVQAGLFDFLAPTASKTIKKGSRATEIVDTLLQITANTDGGIKASKQLREEVEELVDELEDYCIRNPLQNDLIVGDWEVVYASKPQTAGGPFRSPIGRTVFPGQKATQSIEPPNVCINEVSYKTLGFIPGAARQEGLIEPIDGKTFQLVFPKLDGKKGGPPQRVIQIAYLDDRIRVARAIAQEEGKEDSFYVFKRIEYEDEEEEPVVVQKKKAAPPPPAPKKKQAEYVYVDEEPAPEPAQKKRGSPFGTQIFGKKESMATQAERAYYEKGGMAAPPPAPKGRGTQGTQQRSAGTGTTRISREEQVAARAAAEEQRRLAKQQAEEERMRAREAALAAKAQQEEERRRAREAAEQAKQQAAAQAIAAREELAQRKAAAAEQFNSFKAEALETANEAKEASAAAKEAERATASLLKQASQSENRIAEAVDVVQTLVSQLQAAQNEEKVVEKEVIVLQKTVNELEKKARQQLAQLAGKRY